MTEETERRKYVAAHFDELAATLRRRLDGFYPRATIYQHHISLVSVSVCHKSVFYQNGWTDRTSFWLKSCIVVPVYFIPPSI